MRCDSEVYLIRIGGRMDKILTGIILFAICVALIAGVVMPLSDGIKVVGQKSFDSVKTMSDNIK